MLCIIFHILFHYGLLKNVEYRRTPVLMSVLKMFDFFFTHPELQFPPLQMEIIMALI